MNTLDVLRTAMVVRGWRPAGLAREMGISLSHLRNLLAGHKPIVPRTAVRFHRVLGIRASFILPTACSDELALCAAEDYATAKDPRSCAKQCPGGQNCVLDNRFYHVAHICSDSGCECHGRQRYEPSATPKKRPPRHDSARNEDICMELPHGVASRQETALESIARGNH